MTLKVVITPPYLPDVQFQVDNEFCVENMRILVNMRPEICVKAQLIFNSKFKGRGGSRITVTKCDNGRRGSQIGDMPLTYILNGPLFASLYICIFPL